MAHQYSERVLAFGLLLLFGGLASGCAGSSDPASGGDSPEKAEVTIPSDPCGNGTDDDADGSVDEGCVCASGESQDCFSGPLASRGVGACRDGEQMCTGGAEFGTWEQCQGDVLPTDEACDGQDADCDGAIDEGCPCTNVGEARACGLEFVVAPCTGGVQTCRADGTWTDCEGAIAPEPEVCNDGIDNNCDGEADELCSACPDPEPETCGDRVDNDCDGDIDEPGCVSECGNELCGNGIDDDCDGEVDEDACPPCTTLPAPENSFDPRIQWVWHGLGDETESVVMPLVANLTDDDGDGHIGLSDVPDVVVVVATRRNLDRGSGSLCVLDGETGGLHGCMESPVDNSVTPALGDIDGDGIPEIVSAQYDGRLVAFEHTGELKWLGDRLWTVVPGESTAQSIALADLDNDGDVEIIGGNAWADHEGTLLFAAEEPSGPWGATTAADLDGDGDLEVVLGHAAYHHDGTEYYVSSGVLPGYPQIADFDGDGLPEVLVINRSGLTMLEHTGAVVYRDRRPTGVEPGFATWVRPAAVHDFDGDSLPEFAMSSEQFFTVYEPDARIVWSARVDDASGVAAGTAFDFLGDGVAEAMYADESNLFLYGDTGAELLSVPRDSATLSEYPVVADVDNDGSAEIVVVSNAFGAWPRIAPTVQVIRDVSDRWMPTRRIWNQHTYHVTNTDELGSIPRFEAPSWRALNTFRTNAQIEDGALCIPPLY